MCFYLNIGLFAMSFVSYIPEKQVRTYQQQRQEPLSMRKKMKNNLMFEGLNLQKTLSKSWNSSWISLDCKV